MSLRLGIHIKVRASARAIGYIVALYGEYNETSLGRSNAYTSRT